jgi:hypothetical protein
MLSEADSEFLREIPGYQAMIPEVLKNRNPG